MPLLHLLVPRLLPQSDSDIESVKFSVGYELNNGFDLIWHVLELVVPGFKSTNPVPVPSWTAALGILVFCQEHLLYFCLQSKHNMFLVPICRPIFFFATSSIPNMLMWLQLFNPMSTPTPEMTMEAT